METLNYAYLIFVDAEKNHNKFYEIEERSDGTLSVNYGRVGATANHITYRTCDKNFYSLKASKERKGYADVTSLHCVRTQEKDKEADISLPAGTAGQIVKDLVDSYENFFRSRYTIRSTDVNEKMLSEALDCLNALDAEIGRRDAGNPSVYRFNDVLMRLYAAIPRRMQDVSGYIAASPDDFDGILAREQSYYETVRMGYGRRRGPADRTPQESPDLESMGIKVSEAGFGDVERIIRALARQNWEGIENTKHFVSAVKIENRERGEAFEKFVAKNGVHAGGIKTLWHGSRTQNYWPILKNGFSLNPDSRVPRAGKMFGQGAYFAVSSQKSWGYISAGHSGRASRWSSENGAYGYLALFSVAVGKSYTPSVPLGGAFTADSLRDGCLSVWAKPGRTSGIREEEVIAFCEDQMRLDYIVRVSSEERRLDFSLDRAERRRLFYDGFSGALGRISVSDGQASAPVNAEELSDEVRQMFVSRCPEGTPLEIGVKDGRFVMRDAGGEIDGGFTKDDEALLSRAFMKAFAGSEKEFLEKYGKEPEKKNRTETEMER